MDKIKLVTKNPVVFCIVNLEAAVRRNASWLAEVGRIEEGRKHLL